MGNSFFYDDNYCELLEQYGGIAMERQMHLQEIIRDLPWSADLELAVVRFGNECTFSTQVLGSFSYSSGSWLWAWANEHLTTLPDVLNDALQLKTYGKQHGISALYESCFECIKDELHLIGTVATGILGLSGYYLADYGEGVMLVGIRDTKLDTEREAKNALQRILSTFPQLISLFEFDHRNAFVHYAKANGFDVSEDGPPGECAILTATKASVSNEENAFIFASFDAESRLMELRGFLARDLNRPTIAFPYSRNDEQAVEICCSQDSFTVNGKKFSFPLSLPDLEEVIGEPDLHERGNLLWHVAWHKLGIYLDYASINTIICIGFLVRAKAELPGLPVNTFSGRIFVEGKLVFDGQCIRKELFQTVVEDDRNYFYIELKGIKLSQLIFRGDDQPYAISIGKNYNYKKEIPQDKYRIKQPGEEVVEFSDFGFKISIIQVLMYELEVLTPKFDLDEFADWYNERRIDIEEEGYEPIPEVTQYFRELPVPKRFAPLITEISQDGGNAIYLQLVRYGEGYEDYWNICSAADARHFPNLTTATLCYATQQAFDEFNKMGIDTEWI